MQKESQSGVVMTPEEERELQFPVKEEQSASWNCSPLQMVILFLQFCLVGLFLGAVISNDPEQHEVAPPRKIAIIAIERVRKAGGGFKYRLVAGKKGGIEAIIMENLPSNEQLATIDVIETNEQTTAIQWLPTSDPPLKIITPRLQATGAPQLSIAQEASMPSPPVPPPWSTQALSGRHIASDGQKQQRSKELSTTRAPFKLSYHRNDFFRG